MVASLTATTMVPFATAANAAPSLVSQHVLHVFPSFGVGGVPLRMVRIINHFGKRFRHTVIALDNNFAAAAGLDVDMAGTRPQAIGHRPFDRPPSYK